MERIESILELKRLRKRTVSGLETEKVMTGDDKVVYCLMRKIGNGGNFSENKDKKTFGKSGSFKGNSQNCNVSWNIPSD